MRKFITTIVASTIALAVVANGVAIAGVVMDQKCTTKQGAEYQCSIGMLHRVEHIRECASEWKASTERSTKSETWPAFWHACSDKLKASQANK